MESTTVRIFDHKINKMKSLNMKRLHRTSIAVTVMFALSVLIKITLFN